MTVNLCIYGNVFIFKQNDTNRCVQIRIDAICGVQIREWLKEMGIAENI